VVSHCANPSCATPLRYLREGRLFQFEVKSLNHLADSPEGEVNGPKRPSRQVWHYWLCGHCSSDMTLQFDQVQGLKLTPREEHPCSQLAS